MSKKHATVHVKKVRHQRVQGVRKKKERQWRQRVKAPVGLMEEKRQHVNMISDKWCRSPGEHYFPVSKMAADVLWKLTKPLSDQWQVIKCVSPRCSLAVVGQSEECRRWPLWRMTAHRVQSVHKRILDQSFILMSSPDWHTAIYLFENYNQQKIKSKINYLLRPIGHSGEWWVQLRGLSLLNNSSAACLLNEKNGALTLMHHPLVSVTSRTNTCAFY